MKNFLVLFVAAILFGSSAYCGGPKQFIYHLTLDPQRHTKDHSVVIGYCTSAIYGPVRNFDKMSVAETEVFSAMMEVGMALENVDQRTEIGLPKALEKWSSQCVGVDYQGNTLYCYYLGNEECNK